jgi:hypothetical protein
MRRTFIGIALVGLVLGSSTQGGVRDRTRAAAAGAPAVSEAQASILTLTLTEAAVRPIQVWVRVSIKVDPSGRRATATVRGPDAQAIQPGQRVRCFTVASRSQMHQAKIVSVTRKGDSAQVVMAIADDLISVDSPAIAEIVADRGDFLSVPNVSLIEEEGRQLVYIQRARGQYEPRTVTAGLQGELYTEIRSGLSAGDQVVSIGSFFIDAQAKLRSSAGSGMAGMNHGAMPGMDHGAMPGMSMPGQ